jgi:putative inorganic carbon (HCO3(-)) transporter
LTLASRPVAFGGAVVGAAALAYAVRSPDGWHALALLLVLIAVGCIGYLLLQARPSLIMSLALVLMCLSGYWVDLAAPLPIDRLAIALSLGLVLARPEMRAKLFLRLRQPLTWLLALLALYTIVSAMRAGTLTQEESLYTMLDSLGIVPFALYVVAPVVFETERDRDILMTTLVCLGAYLGLTAMFEMFHVSALVFPKYILNPNIGIHFGRARGPFVEADANGLAMFACAVASVIAAVRWRGTPKATFALGVVALCAFGILLTLTRAVWIGSAIGCVVTLLAFAPLRRYVVPVVLIGAVGAVGALTLVPGLSGDATKRSDELRPVWDRLNTDAAALRMVQAKPLTGFGWHTFQENSPTYLRQASSFPLTGSGLIVHNVFLARLSELGLIGTLMFVIAFGWAIGGSAIRAGPPEMLAWKMGLVAIAIDWVVVANFVQITYAMPTALIWLWAGMISPVPRDATATNPGSVRWAALRGASAPAPGA